LIISRLTNHNHGSRSGDLRGSCRLTNHNHESRSGGLRGSCMDRRTAGNGTAFSSTA
jgi:hypothetical protein